MANMIEAENSELKLILNSISHSILFETTRNEIIFINQNFCDLFGIPVSPEMLVGADCSKAAEQSSQLFMDPESFVNGIIAVYAAGTPVMNEELVLADGRSIYRDYKPIISTTGYSGHLWIYKHSLELRNILMEVRDQKNFYENLLNNIPADIAIFDKDHKYLFLNHIAISKNDTRHWLVGKDDFDFCREKNKPLYQAVSRRAMFVEAMQTGETVEFEETNTRSNGSKVHNLRRFYPLKKSDGTIDNVIGYGINITKIKEREDRLMEQEQALRDLVDSMDQLVVSVNENGNIVYTNPRWTELTGETINDYIGKKLSTYIKRGRDSFIENVKSFFNGVNSKTRYSHVCITDKHGKSHTLSYYISSLNTLHKQQKQAAVFFNDITEQLSAEKKLKKIAREERHLNELKSSFMSLVSHELRTPLSVILSSAELIEMLQEQKKVNTEVYTERIIHQVDKMTQLMNEFLFLSKAETGKIPFNPLQIDAKELIEKLITELYAPWQDGRHLKFSVKGQARKLMGDSLMISHTITNLINNAFKYSAQKPAPQLRLVFSEKSWQFILLDFGIGVSEGEKKKIFQPFIRGRNVGGIEGTGFGLMVVKFFVKMHKGKIIIKSIEGKGTAIAIQFPY